MEKNNYQETCRMVLQVKSPICIADGVTLNAKEYLYDPKRQQIYFLNQLEWHKFIYQHKLLPSYEDFLLGRGKNSFNQNDVKASYAGLSRNSKMPAKAVPTKTATTLYEWLRGCGYDIADLQQANVIKSSAQAEVNVMKAERKNTLNDVATCIKQVDGTPYIPGSSLKGVLRTAILFKLLREHGEIKAKYWQLLKQNIGGYTDTRKVDNIAKQLEKECLEKLNLGDTKDGDRGVLKGLLCSDAYVKENVTMGILQKVDYTFDREGNLVSKKLPIFRECILPGNEFYFDLKVDSRMLGLIGIKSVNDVLACVESFYQFLDKLYSSAYGNTYSDIKNISSSGNIFVGCGTGFLTKTLLAGLAPSHKDAKDLIKQLLQSNRGFAKHNHLLRDKVISPRALKCTQYGGQKMLMGLGLLKKDE